MTASTISSDNKKRFSFRCPRFLKDIHSGFYYYLMLVVIGIFFFSASLFTNYFTTPFTGDYTAQQYAFYTNGYDDWWHFFKTGEFVLYDTNTFLGASNIGSNSFYYLFDPFFMPILLFPRSIIPQGIAVMTIFKMALAGFFFSIYMSSFKVKKYTARLAGLMYAFCGWTTWYLWFNHFTGVAVIFPIILLGIEKILKEKKPWLLALSLFILGLTNFFFFFTFTVCAFLYAMFRYFCLIRTYKRDESLYVLLIGFLSFLTGCLLASVVVIPAMMVALNAPRATSSTYLPGLLEALKNGDLGTFFYKIFSWESETTPYKVYYPILDFIFPVMSDRGTPLTKLGNETYDNIAGSLFCFSPIIIFFIPALISSTRKKHFAPLIATTLFSLMLFTPFTYYAFHGFTYAYSRWTLFVTTSLIAYVSLYIDRIEEEPRWHLFVGSAFALIMCWLAIILAKHMADTYSNFRLRYVYDSLGPDGFLYIEGAVFTLYVLVITTLLFFFYDKKWRKLVFTLGVVTEAIIMGTTTLYGHGYENYMDVNNGYRNNNVFQSLIEKIKKDDPSYYRCYSSQENNKARNDSMRHDYNGLGTFHSVYNYNTATFLNWSDITDYTAPGSYSASYVEKRQDLDTFLGVKYYFVHKNNAFWGNKEAQDLKVDNYRANVPLGFVDITSRYPNDTYYVYENTNFIDFAFAFDQVATYDNLEENGTIKEPSSLFGYTFLNEELYLNAAIVGENNLKYLEDKIDEDNIYQYEYFADESEIGKISQFKYKTTYYDIHGDAETGRIDASSSSFVSHLLNLEEYPSQTTKPEASKYNGRYVTVIEAKEGFPYDKDGLVIYLKNGYKDEQDINVYLVTIDNEGNERFVTFDNHNDSHLSNNWSSRKLWRGFYTSPTIDEEGNQIDAHKISKIIIASRKTNVGDYVLYYQTGTSVKNRLEKFNDNPVTDIKYKTNHFDFKTNFLSHKVVVTQLPYEEGWTLKATLEDGSKKNIDIFTAQGGFVSFVSEVGITSYELEFYTPYLKVSSYISIIGLIIFNLSLAFYMNKNRINDIENIEKDNKYRRNPSKIKYF